MSILQKQTVPTCSFLSTDSSEGNFEQYRGRWIVLYFYPKDNTPGCTKESRDFARLYDDFSKLGAVILGVSLDSLSSHLRFKTKWQMPFELITDPESCLSNLFGVIKEKSLYGRRYRGIDRSTFLIDEQGVIREKWLGVKVTGHAEEVLKTLRALKA